MLFRSTELVSEARLTEDTLDLWLIQGAERFRRDTRVADALLKLARHSDSRKCVLLLGLILENPELVERLWQVLDAGEEQEAASPERDEEAHAVE